MTADLQSALVAAGEHPNVFTLNCGCKDKQKKRNAKHIAHFLRYFLFFTPFCWTSRKSFMYSKSALHKLNGAAHRYIDWCWAARCATTDVRYFRIFISTFFKVSLLDNANRKLTSRLLERFGWGVAWLLHRKAYSDTKLKKFDYCHKQFEEKLNTCGCFHNLQRSMIPLEKAWCRWKSMMPLEKHDVVGKTWCRWRKHQLSLMQVTPSCRR